jgi:hypothetical protein
MRSYYARNHRVLANGAVEIEGRWRGVVAIAIGMTVALVFLRRIPGLTLGLLAFGVYLLVFPPKRRVTFDGRARAIRIEHAGLFRERWSRSIEFSSVRAIVVEGGAGRFSPAHLLAQTDAGEVYLLSLRDAVGASVERRVRDMMV